MNIYIFFSSDPDEKLKRNSNRTLNTYTNASRKKNINDVPFIGGGCSVTAPVNQDATPRYANR